MDIFGDEKQTKCKFCNKSIKITYIRKHCLRFHSNGSNRRRRIICCLCKQTFAFRKQLRDHVQTHDIHVHKKLLSFNSPTEFQKWLNDEQNSLKLRFIRGREPSVATDGTKRSDYVCQYDNTHIHPHVSSNKRKRAVRNRGSYKLDGSCTASIHVVEQENGDTKVEYYNVHLGHVISPAHFYLNAEEKLMIAEKLKSGENFSRILNDIKNNVSDRKIQRTDLISRKTLHNIAFSLNYWKPRLNDIASVDKWIEEISQKDYNAVCFYKRQGEAHDILKKHDFMLVVVTKIQREFLLEFGNNIVCVNSTQGTNRYDFQITTMLVVDYQFESLPVAFCFSNVVRCSVMEIFFKQIRLKTAKILTPRVFVSDDFDFHHEAWVSVMGVHPMKRLLCTCHVDRNWRRNILKIVGKDEKSKQSRISVYRKLRKLSEESDESVFLQFLGRVITDLLSNSETEVFGEYLKKKWLNRTEKWAYCYRVGCGINTNLRLENLHRIIKHVYNKGSKIKRLDDCIYSLLKIVREKFFERFLKMKESRVASLQDGIVINDIEVEVESSEYVSNSSSIIKEHEGDCREGHRSVEYFSSLLSNDDEMRPEPSVTFIKSQLDLCIERALETDERSSARESNRKRKLPKKFNLSKKKRVDINSITVKMPIDVPNVEINNCDRNREFIYSDHLY